MNAGTTRIQKITIDPITRLEGHGKIEIFLNEEGNVQDAYLQIPELRGFEQFCVGRPAEEMARITPRICGVCPLAHHFASAKALDAAFQVEPTSTAKKLRELMYMAYFIYDHTLHFYYLGGPDFIVGPDAAPGDRNIVGVIGKVGMEVGKEVIKHRAYGQKIIQMLGGKATHPVCGLPGGISKGLSEDERVEIETMARSCIEFGQFTLDLFDELILSNRKYLDLILGDTYQVKTHHMGLVDEDNRVNFYDGMIRVKDHQNDEIAKFDAENYLDYIEEHVEPWTYAKFPYLKKYGWQGLAEDSNNGIYRVAPLSRLNVSDGMATPIAQLAYERFYTTLGEKPVQSALAYHWARVIELMYACERLLELATDPEITSPDIRNFPDEPSRGVGVIEAARGTLIHDYRMDKNGMIEQVNLIVATVNNNAAINLGVKKTASHLIKNFKVSDGLLNMVEMTFRAYDPCFACATHSLPGQMPMKITIYDVDKNVYQQLVQ